MDEHRQQNSILKKSMYSCNGEQYLQLALFLQASNSMDMYTWMTWTHHTFSKRRWERFLKLLNASKQSLSSKFKSRELCFTSTSHSHIYVFTCRPSMQLHNVHWFKDISWWKLETHRSCKTQIVLFQSFSDTFELKGKVFSDIINI